MAQKNLRGRYGEPKGEGCYSSGYIGEESLGEKRGHCPSQRDNHKWSNYGKSEVFIKIQEVLDDLAPFEDKMLMKRLSICTERQKLIKVYKDRKELEKFLEQE